MVALETLLVYKTAPDDIPPAPLINKICWAASAVFFLSVTFLVVRRFEDEDHKDKKHVEWGETWQLTMVHKSGSAAALIILIDIFVLLILEFRVSWIVTMDFQYTMTQKVMTKFDNW